MNQPSLPHSTFPRNKSLPSLGGKEEVRRLMELMSDISRPDKYGGKRIKPRLKGAIWMEVQFDPGNDPGEKCQVSTHDLSEGGVSVWLRQRVEAGATLYLRDCAGDTPGPWLRIRVTHCINGLKGFLVGGEFQFD